MIFALVKKLLKAKTGMLFVLLSFFSSSSAYVIQASLWRECENSQKRPNYFIVCHDIHNYSQSLNESQTIAFKSVIPTAKDLSLIIEDQPGLLSDYTDRNLLNCGAELTQLAKDNGLNVHGIDFRHKKNRAYYLCLQGVNVQDAAKLDRINQRLIEIGCTSKELSFEFNAACINVLETLDVLEAQKKITAKTAKTLRDKCTLIKQQWQKELDAWDTFEGTFLEYCQKNQCLNAEYLGRFVVYDAELVDLRLFLKVLQADTRITLVYAGGVHCNNLGYYLHNYSKASLVKRQGIDFKNNDALKIPEGTPPNQTANYAMNASMLHKTDGTELKPLDSTFLMRIIENPDLFIEKLPWWEKLRNYIIQLAKPQ